MTTTRWIVNTDGTIEELSIFDLAAEIGPEVNTSKGFRLRWQPAYIDGKWGVVDASNRSPQYVLGYAENEEEAIMLAAEWNVSDGMKRDLAALGIYDVANDRETAERLAVEARDLTK